MSNYLNSFNTLIMLGFDPCKHGFASAVRALRETLDLCANMPADKAARLAAEKLSPRDLELVEENLRENCNKPLMAALFGNGVLSVDIFLRRLAQIIG